MCQIILDKLFVKFQQFLKMEHLKLPSYLNTLEKYNEMIRATDTVKKYEEVFYNLLGDESLPLLDILTLMRCIERDVILVHGINDVTHLLELTESFIRYMISMSEESDKNNTKGNIKNEEDSKSSSSENDKNWTLYLHYMMMLPLRCLNPKWLYKYVQKVK